MSNPSLLNTLLRFISGDRKFKRALIQLPLGDIDKIVTGHDVSYYQQWLQHDAPGDPYWTPASHSSKVGAVSAPVHLLSGWYDFFLPSTVRDYTALRKAGKKPYLTIGPWAHSDFAHNGVAIDEALAFFNAYVKGEKGRLRDQPVRIWVNGAEEWRHYPDFPPPGTQYQQWYLQDRGRLAPMPPDDSAPDIYRYDPSDPTPAVGGPLGPGLNVKAGSFDNRVLEARSDVLTYTSSPLKCDMEVIGPVSTELYVRSSLKHTDFFVRLCDVEPSGKSLNVCDGLQRLFPDRPVPEQDGCLKIVFDLWPTAHRFRRQHCIRLQVSSGAFPRWARNLGTGEPLTTGTRLQVAEQNVYHDPAHPSAVILPCQGP